MGRPLPRAAALVLAACAIASAGPAWAEPPAKVDLSLPPSALPPGAQPPAPRARLFGKAEPSPVVYPPQQLPLRFSHAQHLRMKVECVFCHEGAEKSLSAKDNLLPKEEVCESCHNIDHEEPFKKTKVASRCAACHPRFPTEAGPGVPPPGPQLEALVAKVQLPPPNLRFNHKIHATQKIPCERCHGDLSRADLATREGLPTMALCLSCHSGSAGLGALKGGRARAPSGRCGTCHPQQPDGTLQVRFDSGVLMPSGNWKGDAHGLEFKREHGSVARAEPAYCESCHRQSFCQSCHNGVVKPMDFHGNDYVSRHPIDARRNTPDCGGCHRRQTFCLGCHERLGVVDRYTLPGSPQPGAFAPAQPRRFHPDGWASPSAGAGHHAFEAQRNLRQCVSCHREDTCLQCHSALPGSRSPGAVGTGVSPHPGGWARSARCQALADRNPRVCLKCHGADSPALRCLEP